MYQLFYMLVNPASVLRAEEILRQYHVSTALYAWEYISYMIGNP